MPEALPEECLWLIVSYLRHERATLHALLLTNSTLFRIAVSYLYASPFRLLHEEPSCHWSVVERTRRYDSLVHLLIHSSRLHPDTRYSNKSDNGNNGNNGDNIVSRLPRYGPEVPALPTPSTVDYLSYYTDMFHDPMLHETFMTLFPSIPNCYMANVIWYRPMVETRNKIDLAMMDRLSPQLTSLVVNMPILVPRIKLAWMSNLHRLEVLGTDFCLLNEEDLELERTMHTNRAARSANGYAMTPLDRMLTFIWDHQRLFGTLRELKIEQRPVAFERQPSSRLVELVEAMGDRLEVLDVQYWPDAVRFLDRFPTHRIKSLLLHQNKDPGLRLELSGNMSTLLTQYSRLEEISLYTGEKDLFKAWRPEYGIGGTYVASSPSIMATTFYRPTTDYVDSNGIGNRHWERARMRRISLAGLGQNVIAAVNEAVDLFASTLEVLTVRSWFGGKLSTIPISWSGSILRRLTDLDLEGEVAWTFDFASLLGCPRLCRIRLGFTGPMPGRSLKKQPAIQNLTRITTLQDVELVGNWETLANRGWPAVIARLHHLERLDLNACEGISADQVFSLVRDIIEQSAQWRLGEDEATSSRALDGQQTGPRPLMTQEYLYCYCRLRWMIVSKRLKDKVLQLWDEWRTSQGMAKATPFVRASAERVRFSFAPAGRPTR
ncbi:hypothetical protein BC939DRAFT_443087 [Gamsiella multidivaricata]|uniref:uncharacterized protein n=1 Tax=Gamsiella multidivaricata TaxID=101098 RepID=UPI00221F7E77|nr:uncharacterized protein BC939DRAFT_443087 [Gamsiella multidivaricata]KAG0352927.1 hypothetical protein BGZ54_002511 [Gamsiella multidivaricata]KAI7828842.1 hypothetical protein BC939DRAFT_443087 [Gamsiella multidivaricata]